MQKMPNGIYIPDDLRKLFTIDEWLQRAHPETTRTVVLVSDFGMLEIAKEDLVDEFDFDGAQKAAAAYGDGFRCATRHEVLEMYDARFWVLDAVFEKIGGQLTKDVYWTCEVDPAPEYTSDYAFVYNGDSGGVAVNCKYRGFAVRPVRPFVSAIKE